MQLAARGVLVEQRFLERPTSIANAQHVIETSRAGGLMVLCDILPDGRQKVHAKIDLRKYRVVAARNFLARYASAEFFVFSVRDERLAVFHVEIPAKSFIPRMP